MNKNLNYLPMQVFAKAILLLLLLSGCTHAYVMQSADLLKANGRCLASDVVVTPESGFFTLNERDEISKIQEVTCFDGDLIVAGDFSEIYLPNLQFITGSLIIAAKPLRKLSLPHFEQITGDFLVGQAEMPLASLEDFGVPLLKEVGGRLSVQMTMLKMVNLPALSGVGSFFLRNNSVLTKVGVPALQMANKIVISNNPLLSEFKADQLSRIAGRIISRDNEKLPKCQLEILAKKAGSTSASIEGVHSSVSCSK